MLALSPPDIAFKVSPSSRINIVIRAVEALIF